MTNARGSKGQFVKLHTHETVGDLETNFTFTPLGELLNATYSEILIIIDGNQETTAGKLQMIINGLVGTTNRTLFTRLSTTTLLGVVLASAATLQISSELVCVATREFHTRVTINLSEALNNHFMGFFESGSVGSAVMESGWIENSTAAQTGITTIKIQTSAGAWKANTRFVFYGLKR